jgi:phosphate:Na+ symporter
MTVSDWIKTILYMLSSIGCLLIGFEMLSTNLTKICHTGLKKLFNKTGSSDIVSVGIGAATTAVIQSSGATTIMVVGFVNAGVMSLHQAAAIIMGANIGTTITAQLASLSSFDFGAYALSCAGIGVFINMFAKKEKTKTIGYALAGFGLIFFGLSCMSTVTSIEPVKNVISKALSSVDGPLAPILLFLLGIFLTALVQSSSLVTTIVISLARAGIYIGSKTDTLNNNILYLILGTNIGSCVTALISSIGTNVNAKRASFIHLLFNTLGALIFAVILVIFPNFMQDTFVKVFSSPATQIAMFHTFFNIVCTIIFVPCINIFVRLSNIVIADKPNNKENILTYIDIHMLALPSVAIHQVRKELSLMYKKAVDTLDVAMDGFNNHDEGIKEIVDVKNNELEEINKYITEYIVKLSNENLVYEDECTLSSFHRCLNDILRIGEIGDNICKYTRHMVKDNLQFSDMVFVQINFMRQKIKDLYEQTDAIFISKDISKMPFADAIEDEIDNMRKGLIDDHFDRLGKGECAPQNSGVFVNLVNNLERAADHMTYIAHSVEDAYNQSKQK